VLVEGAHRATRDADPLAGLPARGLDLLDAGVERRGGGGRDVADQLEADAGGRRDAQRLADRLAQLARPARQEAVDGRRRGWRRWRTVGVPARRSQRGGKGAVERAALRPGGGEPGDDGELPVAARGERGDDRLGERLGVAADQRRGQAPGELDPARCRGTRRGARRASRRSSRRRRRRTPGRAAASAPRPPRGSRRSTSKNRSISGVIATSRSKSSATAARSIGSTGAW